MQDITKQMQDYLLKEKNQETQFHNIDSADLMKEFDFDKLYPAMNREQAKAKTAQMQESRVVRGH